MPTYERIASALIGTRLQRPAENMRRLGLVWQRWRHPELRDVIDECHHVQALLERVLTPEMNCIDVGCHLGSMLQQMVRLAPRGRHIAVEPVPYKAAWLKQKFPGVDVRQLALSETAGTAEFFIPAQSSGLSSLHRDTVPGAANKIEVPLARLDDLVPEGQPVGFIKIDVEGYELAVFRGARRLLRSQRPMLLFECTQRGLVNAGVDSSQVFNELTHESGYQVYLIKGRLAGEAPLDAATFAGAMIYPFKAFNFIAVPN